MAGQLSQLCAQRTSRQQKHVSSHVVVLMCSQRQCCLSTCYHSKDVGECTFFCYCCLVFIGCRGAVNTSEPIIMLQLQNSESLAMHSRSTSILGGQNFGFDWFLCPTDPIKYCYSHLFRQMAAKVTELLLEGPSCCEATLLTTVGSQSRLQQWL